MRDQRLQRLGMLNVKTPLCTAESGGTETGRRPFPATHACPATPGVPARPRHPPTGRKMQRGTLRATAHGRAMRVFAHGIAPVSRKLGLAVAGAGIRRGPACHAASRRRARRGRFQSRADFNPGDRAMRSRQPMQARRNPSVRRRAPCPNASLFRSIASAAQAPRAPRKPARHSACPSTTSNRRSLTGQAEAAAIQRRQKAVFVKKALNSRMGFASWLRPAKAIQAA